MSEQPPSPVPRLVPEQPARMVQKIRDTYRIELRQFTRELFGDAGDSSAWLRTHAPTLDRQHVDGADGPVNVVSTDAIRRDVAARGAMPPSFGPVRALTVPGTRYKFVADLADQDVITEIPGQLGTMLRLSVSAWNTLNYQQPVTDEVYPWIPAILGDAWAPHVTDTGTHTGSGGTGRLLTRYFTLYLSPTGHAHGDPLQPL